MDEKLKQEINDFIEQQEFDRAAQWLLHGVDTEFRKTEESEPEDNPYISHYTSVETIYSLLKNYRKDSTAKEKSNNAYLRLYEILSMNDPNEGKHFTDAIKKIMNDETFSNPLREIPNISWNIFTCSFVSGGENVGDRLQYWQSYGLDGMGCSITIPCPGHKSHRNSSDFQSVELMHKHVLYGERIEDRAKQFKDAFELGAKLYSAYEQSGKIEDMDNFSSDFWNKFHERFWWKGNHYRHENEYRYMKILDSSSKDVNFQFKKDIPFLRRYCVDEELYVGKIFQSGTKITLGPRVRDKNHLAKNLKALALSVDLPGPEFISSKINYRKTW